MFVFNLTFVDFSMAEDLGVKLKGRILLQVESKGEAWYVNPDNSKRYYLGRPDDAFKVMRELGLGISNKDFDSFNGVAPKRLSGKILIKVEDSGKAYYVNPANLKMYFLGKPADAFKVMREVGTGIKNNDLDKILENGQIDTTNLKILSNSEIIEKLKSSVVYIETTDGSGSGFVIESNGYILTNAHVVQGVSSAKVIFSDSSELSALVVGRDENIDLALLKVEKLNIKKATLGDSDSVKQGDEIFTLGYPFGIKGDVSFKEGTISRKLNSGDKTYLEISADIHPGNSGGPLVNRYGQVIGISTAIYGDSVQGISVGETIKLAIPVNIAKNTISDLKNGRSIIKPKPSIETKVETTPSCIGSISDLQRIGSGIYNLYNLDDSDLNISMESNEMKLTGIIKNNSSCTAYNIKIKVIITDPNDPSLVQEETVTLSKNSNSMYDNKMLTIYPKNTGEYKSKITVFSVFIKNIYGVSLLIRKELKENVKVQTQIVSADWLPVN